MNALLFGRDRFRPSAVTVAALAGLAVIASTGSPSGAATKSKAKVSPSKVAPAKATSTTAAARAASPAPSTTVPSTTAAPLGRMVVGEGGELPGLDPAAVNRQITLDGVSTAIYEQLMDLQIGKPPRPYLAELLTEAPDRRSWTLQVRDGVRFHDGTSLTADAVKVNLERQRKSRTFGQSMVIIKSVDVTGPLTVKLSLDRPYASLPYLLGGTVGLMISPKAISEKADRLNREPTDAGTGPYVLKEFVPGDHSTVVRNPNYWGNPKPRLDQITFRMIPDEGARYAALRAGDLQTMITLFPGTVNQARADGFSIIDPPTAGSGAIMFNNSKPPFNDVRIRRAAALARNGRALAELIEDTAFDRQGFGLWPKDSPWFSPVGHDWSYDRAEAKRLVASYTAETGRDVSFTYLNLGLSASGIDSARLTVRYWQDAGMDVKLQILPDVNQFALALLTGQYQAAAWLVALQQDPDATAYPVLSSTSTGNFARYKSVEMDTALENGRNAADVEGRKAAYTEVQRLFRRDVPFIVTSLGTLHLISSKTVCGLDDLGGFSARTVGLGNC